MQYVIPPPVVTALPVQSESAMFPVHKIYCVGQNYAEHTREMGGDPERNPPFFFCKPAGAAYRGEVFPYPSVSQNVHHEVELVVALKSGGRDIPVERASELIYGYAVGLDMTRRDLQAEAKASGRPWDSAKGFDFSAPCSALVPSQQWTAQSAEIWLEVNGRRRQQGNLNQMIWSVAEILSHLSRLFRLEPGDLVFTGTPAGVGPIARGDTLVAGIEGLARLTVRVE